MGKKIIVTVGILFLLSSIGSAETIYLKNGKKIQGQIIEKTDKNVKINIQGVTLTYFSDEIEKIEDVASPQPAAAQGQAKTPPSLGSRKPETLNPVSWPSSTANAGPSEYSPSHSAPASSRNKKDLILSLIDASGAKDNMNQMLSQIMSQASPEESQKLRDIFSIDEVINQLVPVYDKYFTEEELLGLIAFYKSPLGQKLLTVTPLVMKDSLDASLQYFQKKTQPLQVQPSTQPQGQ